MSSLEPPEAYYQGLLSKACVPRVRLPICAWRLLSGETPGPGSYGSSVQAFSSDCCTVFPPCWFSLPPGCHPESIVSIPFGCLCLASSFLPGLLTFPSLLFFPFPGCMIIRESCLSTICILQSRSLMRGAVYSMPCSVHLGVQQTVAELGSMTRSTKDLNYGLY